MKKTKSGEVEFSMPASALGTNCCPQATKDHDTILLKQAWTKNAPHTRASRGRDSCFHQTITSNNTAAMDTRSATKVKGGIVLSASFMSGQDPPHSTASRSKTGSRAPT